VTELKKVLDRVPELKAAREARAQQRAQQRALQTENRRRVDEWRSKLEVFARKKYEQSGVDNVERHKADLDILLELLELLERHKADLYRLLETARTWRVDIKEFQRKRKEIYDLHKNLGVARDSTATRLIRAVGGHLRGRSIQVEKAGE
jgi:hypothetical protein